MTYTLSFLLVIGLKTELILMPGMERQWCQDQAERMARKIYRDHHDESIRVVIECLPEKQS